MNKICDRCLKPIKTKRLGRMRRLCFEHYAEAMAEIKEVAVVGKKLGYGRQDDD